MTINTLIASGEAKMTLTEIIEQLEWCDYQCEAGTLKNNVAFIQLKRMSEDDNSLLAESQRERDEAHAVIRDLLGALGPYQEHTGSIPWKIGYSLANAKIRAIQLLRRYITEDG